MDDYKDRLIAEHIELGKKIEKLEIFMKTKKYSDMFDAGQHARLMAEQLQMMKDYHQILPKRMRISAAQNGWR